MTIMSYKHLKRFGFTCEHKSLGIKYGITINSSDNKKIDKQLTWKSGTRKKLV